MKENLESFRIEVELPDFCFGAVQQGSVQGRIVISAGSYILQEIPLVADRTLRKGNIIAAAADRLLAWAYRKRI